MNLLIMFGVMWAVITELIFIMLRINDPGEYWFTDKMASVFFGLVVVSIMWGCYNLWILRTQLLPLFFIIGAIAAFFGINYLIYKAIEYMKNKW